MLFFPKDGDETPDWDGVNLAGAYPYYLLDLCPLDELPHIAGREVAAGHGGKAVAALASLKQPTAGEVEELLPQALREIGVRPTSRHDFLEEKVRGTISGLLDGTLSLHAAREILSFLWHRVGLTGDELLILTVTVVAGLASDAEDPNEAPATRASRREEAIGMAGYYHQLLTDREHGDTGQNTE